MDLPIAKPAVRRVLVINPNTNPEVTRRISEHVKAGISAGIAAEIRNPTSGPFSIETAADRASAVPAVLDMIRQSPDCDGYVLACFDDIAVDEARQLVRAPVYSLAQVAIETAAEAGERFTIVTTVEDQIPAIQALIAKYGAKDIGSVRACRIGVAEASRQTDRAEALLDTQIRTAIADDGAAAVVLGSGAYAGRADELAAKYGIRIVEGLSAAIARMASPA
ncbi:MAG: aspartate/glutamate racemase family protein [Oricola sp.]